jgi:hypothetical protein
MSPKKKNTNPKTILAPSSRRKEIPPDDVAVMVDLANSGIGRNEIARRTGWSTATVSKCCAAAGATFDRTFNEAARVALGIDLKDRQLGICHDLYGIIEETIDDLRSPSSEWKWTPDGMVEIPIGRPTAQDARSMMVTIGIAIDKAELLFPAGDGAGKGAITRLLDGWDEKLTESRKREELNARRRTARAKNKPPTKGTK